MGWDAPGLTVMKLLVGLGVAAGVPAAGLSLGGANLAQVMGGGAQPGGLVAPSGVGDVLSQALGQAGIAVPSGLPGAPAPVKLVTYTPPDARQASAGVTVEGLTLKGVVGDGTGAILEEPGGRTFIVREGQVLQGMEARVVRVSMVEVVLEQRVRGPDGEHHMAEVVLR